jgi:hypothetical protein
MAEPIGDENKAVIELQKETLKLVSDQTKVLEDKTRGMTGSTLAVLGATLLIFKPQDVLSKFLQLKGQGTLDLGHTLAFWLAFNGIVISFIAIIGMYYLNWRIISTSYINLPDAGDVAKLAKKSMEEIREANIATMSELNNSMVGLYVTKLGSFGYFEWWVTIALFGIVAYVAGNTWFSAR